MISVLSLVVAILALFIGLVGPLMAWTVARQQNVVAARESWMREFREQMAKFVAGLGAREEFFDIDHERMSLNLGPETDGMRRLNEIKAPLDVTFQMIQLLLAKQGGRYSAFMLKLNSAMELENDCADGRELIAAADILRRERAGIVADQGAWRPLLTTLGLRRAGNLPKLPDLT